MPPEIEERIVIPDHLMRPEDFAVMREKFRRHVDKVGPRHFRLNRPLTIFDVAEKYNSPDDVRAEYSLPTSGLYAIIGGRLPEGVSAKLRIALGPFLMVHDVLVSDSWYFACPLLAPGPGCRFHIRMSEVTPWRFALEQMKAVVWEKLAGQEDTCTTPFFVLRMWVAVEQGDLPVRELRT